MQNPFTVWLVLAGLACAADPVEVSKDTTLDPKKTYGPIVVTAANITIDGQGAWVVGAGGANPKEFKGVGILARGVSGVTLRNVNVKGFETGLRIEDAEGWTVEGCDFSDNFHDPDFGWGENGRRGGIVLSRVRKSVLRGNKANRVGTHASWRSARGTRSRGTTSRGARTPASSCGRAAGTRSPGTTSPTACASLPARSTPATRRAS
mgnify:CR=1 FL=1